MEKEQIYYLVSSETDRLKEPHQFFLIKEILSSDTNHVFWLIKITPPLERSIYDPWNDTPTDVLLLAPRHSDNYLENIQQYPVYVYVLIPNKDLSQSDRVSTKDFTNTAWGEIVKEPTDVDMA